MAARLHMGLTTVKTHVTTIVDKLRVHNRVQAGVWAHRLSGLGKVVHATLLVAHVLAQAAANTTSMIDYGAGTCLCGSSQKRCNIRGLAGCFPQGI